MDFEKIKTEAKIIWEKLTADDIEEEEIEEVKEEPIIPENTMLGSRMRLIRFVLGFAGMTALMLAIMPDMVTKTLFTIPNGQLTFISMLPISILFIAVYESCDLFGGMIVEWSTRLFDGIRNNIPVPTMIHNMMVPILIVGYIAYKIYYPTILSYLTGVR